MDSREEYDVRIHGDDFTSAVYREDDLSAMLRAHVHFERHLDSMLLLALPNCEPFLEALMFVAKLKIARDMRLVDKPFFRALDKFNALRNKFAHGFERRELDAETDALLVALMPALGVRDGKVKGNELVEVMALRWKEAHPETTEVPDGIWSRFVLLTLHALLLNLVDEVRDGKRR